jgi:septal ring factor EnvC (AmiA/AmiB activator)
VQDDMEKIHNLSRVLEDTTGRVEELEQHVKNLEAEIARREQREVRLIQNNQELTDQLARIRADYDRQTKDRAERGN